MAASTNSDELCLAAERGDEASVSALLAAGADVEAANGRSATALMLAAWNGHEACVSALLAAGAEVEAASEDGATALTLAVRTSHTSCVSALVQAGAGVNAVDASGRTALHIAANRRSESCMSLLMQAGAELRQEQLTGCVDSLGQQVNMPELLTQHHMAMLQGSSRWRRRRPLALVRELRVAAKDEAMARKVWKHCEV